MFSMNVLNYPVVLDFPIFLALGNGGAQSVDFGYDNRQNGGFSPLTFVRGTYERIGGRPKLFQDIPRRAPKFCENRLTDVEKSVDG